MFKSALIIDAQVDFMKKDGALYVPGAEDVIEVINKYLESLSIENGYMGVVFTADTHDPETYPDSEEAKEFPPHCYMGTDGFDLAVEPQRVPGETQKYILNKGVFDMWHESTLEIRPLAVVGEIIPVGGEQDRDEFFKNLVAAGVEDIEVSGVASDYCVKWAIQGLLARGFRVTVYDNLVAGIGRDIHQVAKEDFIDEVADGKLMIL